MEKVILHKRDKNTEHSAKKGRRIGKIPGVIYGKNINNLMFEIGTLELNREIQSNGEHGTLDVEFNGGVYKTLIKEIQREPVSHKIVHIDLEKIPENETIQTDIPVIFQGEDLIRRKGGIVQKEKTNVKVQCRVENIPKHINIDISSLEIGDSYKVCDIKTTQDITFVDELNSKIAFITSNNKSEEDALEGNIAEED